jgi:ligand-binding sensor domain-containing protein
LRKYTIPVCFLLFSFWWLHNASATDKKITFAHYSVSQGLSQSTVNVIFQDHAGFLWIGTEDGLNKFDGINCRYFKKDPTDANSLPHSWIWDIAQDTTGNLWVATYNGLCKMDHAQGRYVTFLPIEGDTTSLSSSRPDCLEHDRDGNLWIGTWGGGLNRFNTNTNSFTRYNPDPKNPKAIPNVLVRTLYKDTRGNLWVGTFGGGICLYNPVINGFDLDFKHPQNLEYEPGKQITAIAEGPENQLWIGTYQNGITVLNIDSLYYQNPDQAILRELKNMSITALMKDEDGIMWIGTQSNGLYIYEDGKLIRIQSSTLNEDGLKGDYIYSIFQERGGTMFIGSSGLNLYHKSRIKFTHIKKASDDSSGLSDGNIWSFVEIRPNTLMIGTQNAGINILDLTSNSFNIRESKAFNMQMGSRYARSMVIDDYNNVWLGTIGAGVDQLVLNEKKVINLNKKFSGSAFGIQQRINALAVKDSILYIGTVASGVFIYDQHTSEISRKKFVYHDTVNVSSEYISTLMIDSSDNLWIGAWGGGFGFVKSGSDTLVRYLHDDKNSRSLSNDIVNAIFEDVTGAIWVGTNFGLNRLVRPKSKTFNSFDEEIDHYFQHHGLSNDVIYAIEGDKNGNLWLSTNRGISKFIPSTGQFISFGVDDELQDYEFNSQSSCSLHDGRLVFGGINGLNIFHPDSINISNSPSKMHITAFIASGKTINLDSLFSNMAELILPYSMNFVTLEYTALDYVAPQKIRYAVKLNGVDDDFIQTGKRRFATYSNLSPGKYSFMLKATNRDGIWNNEPLIFNFRISPPFYFTWWFIIIMTLVVVAIVYIGVKLKIERVLEIERLRTRIASDLHDDIGASLTKITLYSELISTAKGRESFSAYLESINSLSREVIGAMSDIVWSVDARHDNLQDLVDRMKDYSLSACEPSGINLHFHITLDDEKRKLKPLFRQNIYLIYKEAINNIIKHSGASEVNVSINQNGRLFSLSIIDNGKGMSNKRKAIGGNGLPNMEARARQMGGTFNYENNNGLITTLRVKLSH